MHEIIDHIKKFWPTLLVLAVILYATLDSNPIEIDRSLWFTHLDKLIHAIMMGGLTGAIAFDIQRADRKVNKLGRGTMLRICGAVILFGACDELCQSLMQNGRGCEMLDFVADAIGALCAAFMAPPAIRRVLKKRTDAVNR